MKHIHYLSESPKLYLIIFSEDRIKKWLNTAMGIIHEVDKTKIMSNILLCHAGKDDPDTALFVKNHSIDIMCPLKYALEYIEEVLPNAERTYLIDEILNTL